MVFQKKETLQKEKAEMIEFCQKFYQETGKPPTSRILNSRKDCKGASWVNRHFGGMVPLLKASNLPTRKAPSQFTAKLIKSKRIKEKEKKKKEFIEIGIKLREKIGRDLVTDDFRVVEKNDRPGLKVLQNTFGSIGNYLSSINKKVKRRANLSDIDLRKYLKDIKILDSKDCWITDKYTLTKSGYRNFPYKGNKSKIHQVSYSVFKGGVPEGLVVRHSCDNRECYNPDHLSLGTQAENIDDLVSRGKRKSQKNRSGGFTKKFLPRDPYNKKQMKRFLQENTTLKQPFNQMIFNGIEKNSYPKITINGQRYTLSKLILAQKLDVKYEEIKGVTRHILPDGSKPDPRDCNPDHLFLGTQSDNIKDCLSYRKNVKLSEKDWEEIGQSYKREVDKSVKGSQYRWQTKISKKYNITKGHALKIGKSMTDSKEEFCPNILFENTTFLRDQKVGNYKIDFLLPEEKLAVDIVNLNSGSELEGKKISYYVNKLKEVENNGYRYYCFRENEAEEFFSTMTSMIQFKIGNFKKIYARECSIDRVCPRTANVFFEKNHLMGRGRGECFALKKSGVVVAAIRLVKHKDYIDISRFSSKNGYQVIGGLSRLLKHIERTYSPPKIVSFVDARYGNGSSLKTIGFKEESRHPSFSWTDGENIFHRRQFLSNSGYSKGYTKIWDCGQIKFVKYFQENNKIQKNIIKKVRKKSKPRNRLLKEMLEELGSDKEAIRTRFIEIGIQLYNKLGRIPQAKDFRGNPEIPTDSIIVKYFSSLTNFLDACGIYKLEEEKLKKRFIEHTKYLANKLGRSPKARDFKGNFNYSKLRKLFKFNELLSICGLEINRKD